jgi:hypothetical protein
MTRLHDFFSDAEVVYSYSRAQAIGDDILVDVSEVAREAGITFPVALTRAVFEKCVTIPKGVRLQDENGRLWDVCYMLSDAIRRSRSTELLMYKLHVRNDNRDRTPPLITLKAVCRPGDTAAPVITVMMPDED